MRAVKEPKQEGLGCSMDGQVWKREEQGAWVPGWLVQPTLQEYRRKSSAADRGWWRGIEAVLSLEVLNLKGQVRASVRWPGAQEEDLAYCLGWC